MNNTYQEAFPNGFINVMPQLGFSDVQIVRSEECGKRIETLGVVVIIGIVGDLHGNVIYSMSEECAKKIASTMMYMEVEEFDEIAQSAVSELGNMLAANACTILSGMEVTADISTPTLMYGDFTANASFDHVNHFEMSLDGIPFSIFVSIHKK